MWIRSQDKKQLVNENDFYISLRRNKKYCVCTGHGIDLGVYKSREDAIEVLDMLEEAIINKLILFEMPKEEYDVD